MDFMERMAPEYRERIQERIRVQHETGRAAPIMEQEYLRLDGSRLPVETTAVPIRYQDQDAHMVFVRDITEHQQAQAAIANTQKLESLGILAGGIAHDFNNILTAILGNLSLLQSEIKASGNALELFQEAQTACATAKGLSHQLLTFAKGGHPIVKVMDLRPLLKQTASFSTRGSNARCVLELGDSLLAVNIDKEQIAQVIQNLMINAVQAMPEGGTITLRARLVALGANERSPLAAGRYVQVTVQDQGTGIPPLHITKIFDPYFSTKSAGRGLGLAMCYSVMAKHGGHICAESRPGAGATFILHFPAADAAAVAPEPGLPALTPGHGRILIMDDEPSVSKALARMLAHLGYQAESVEDGQAALDAYRRAMATGKPYAAVIMDLTIPGGMGGKDTMRKLSALDPQARAIVSSGYSNDPIMSEYASHGFSGVLTKPYSMEEVSAALHRVIGPEK
jgi:signal transduction histidine kinase/ActR/RegA family two-component response regulator